MSAPLEIAIAALHEIADLEDNAEYNEDFERIYKASALSKKALIDIRREQALFGGEEKA